MKNVIRYISALLLFILAGCEDNENWRILPTPTTPGVGYYISGSATVYGEELTRENCKPAMFDSIVPRDPLDQRKDLTDVFGFFTWLKKDGSFNVIQIVDEDGNSQSYGQGTEVQKTDRATTTELLLNGPAYTVTEDGLYYLVFNQADNQLTILPAKYGIIGDATAGGWNAETPFPSVTFNQEAFNVEFKSDFQLTNASLKFRYSGDWGFEIPYKDGSLKIHSNMGALGNNEPVPMPEELTEVTGGGKNFSIKGSGSHTISLIVDLNTKKILADAIPGEDVEPTPEYPENLYMTGSAYKGWPAGSPWEEGSYDALIPVNGKAGVFWRVAYLEGGADRAFKFAPQPAWSGDFGIAEDNTDAIGTYTKGTKNINVATSGYYLIFVDLTQNSIQITEPKVILKGAAANGSWDSTYDTDAFIVDNDNKTMKSQPFAAGGELRMCAVLPDASIDWWRVEFIVLNEKIEYRGNGGDQERVTVATGGTVTLKFNEGIGSVDSDAPPAPTAMYIVGEAYKGWPGDPWEEGIAGNLIPIRENPGKFWGIKYLNPGEFKFSPNYAWNGDFGVEAAIDDGPIGTYTIQTGAASNLKVAQAGYYLIYVDTESGSIIITEPKVMLKGDVAVGQWDSTFDTDGFAIDDINKLLVSNPFNANGNLRMCAVLPIDLGWWNAEFNIYEGKIIYRGTGGDQDPVEVEQGKQAKLNFIDDTGVIE